ncbi:MAG: hypothetical protein ACQEV6_09725 [Pseudomonadota bacterium]
MIHSLKTLAVAALLAVAPLGVNADDHESNVDEVLVILSSDSLQTQGMSMVLASTMLEKGASVNVLLCDQAGDMALKSYDAPTLKPKDVTPGQMLRGLVSKGATVKVCALYLPNSKHDRDDLFEGVGVAMPPEMADQMLNSEMRTFTF